MAGEAFEAGKPKPPLWPNVERCRGLWVEHVQRWPDPREPERRSLGADRRYPDDPPGSWRGQGDQFLSAEENAEAEHVIGSLCRCEPAVTELLRSIERENKHGGSLVGLEHRLKGAERLKEKIADKMELVVGGSPADVAVEIRDAVRYTFCFEDEDYVGGHEGVVRMLEAQGCTRTYSKNHWLDGQQYKGINSRWSTAEGGQFELQFHTRESFYAKEVLTHPSYERLRSPETRWEERIELASFQTLVCGAVTHPVGIDQVADHGRRT